MRKSKSIPIILLIIVFIVIASSCFAIKLEVEYPVLPSGEKITPTTPLTEYVKYIFRFGIIVAIIAAFFVVTLGGVLYIFSAGRAEIVADAKSRIFAGISGLILIFTIYLIITTINPQLKFLTLKELETLSGTYLIESPSPPGERKSLVSGVLDVNKIDSRLTHIEYRCRTPQDSPFLIYFYREPKWENFYKIEEIKCGQLIPIARTEYKSFKLVRKTEGVYLYKDSSCPDSEEPFLYTAGSSDFSDNLKNKIKSVKIVNDPPNYVWYVSILYDMPNWEGKCMWINPYADCVNVSPFASSISVDRYYADPNGSGNVTFYRKAFFNEDLLPDRQGEGVFRVEHSDLFTPQQYGYYFVYLEQLKFENRSGECNVPIEEQDCKEWDEEGKCKIRRCPTLAGENITSIKINGDYFVLLLYYDEGTEEWNSCQAFPTSDDRNKEGPKQIKWDYIQRKGNLPNAVLIFPIYSK